MAETESRGREAAQPWFDQVGPELAGAEVAWREGNAGKGRVGARRAAGMGLKGWLTVAPQPGYGTSFMHHLNAAADDAALPAGVREAAWRLSARPVPEGGFSQPLAPGLTPMVDARTIVEWAVAAVERLSAAP